jgi:hypothetical protein
VLPPPTPSLSLFHYSLPLYLSSQSHLFKQPPLLIFFPPSLPHSSFFLPSFTYNIYSSTSIPYSPSSLPSSSSLINYSLLFILLLFPASLLIFYYIPTLLHTLNTIHLLLYLPISYQLFFLLTSFTILYYFIKFLILLSSSITLQKKNSSIYHSYHIFPKYHSSYLTTFSSQLNSHYISPYPYPSLFINITLFNPFTYLSSVTSPISLSIPSLHYITLSLSSNSPPISLPTHNFLLLHSSSSYILSLFSLLS